MVMQKLRVLAVCPEWWLVSTLGPGHWTQAIIELFSEEQCGTPTHMHVYDTKKARRAYSERKFTIPPSVVTVSYSQEEV